MSIKDTFIKTYKDKIDNITLYYNIFNDKYKISKEHYKNNNKVKNDLLNLLIYTTNILQKIYYYYYKNDLITKHHYKEGNKLLIQCKMLITTYLIEIYNIQQIKEYIELLDTIYGKINFFYDDIIKNY